MKADKSETHMDSLKLAASSISPAPFKLFVLFTSKYIRDAKWAFVFCTFALPRVSGYLVVGAKEPASRA